MITQFEQDRKLEWAVGSPDGRLLGHVHGYQLTPVGAGETDVTSYRVWSAVPPSTKVQVQWPVVPVDRLERSLVNLEALVTETV